MVKVTSFVWHLETRFDPYPYSATTSLVAPFFKFWLTTGFTDITNKTSMTIRMPLTGSGASLGC